MTQMALLGYDQKNSRKLGRCQWNIPHGQTEESRIKISSKELTDKINILFTDVHLNSAVMFPPPISVCIGSKSI